MRSGCSAGSSCRWTSRRPFAIRRRSRRAWRSRPGVPLILVHVIEPVKTGLAARLHLAGIEAERRAVAEDALQAILASLRPEVHAEALVAYGDPAEELAKVAQNRRAGLVIMGLHGSPVTGPHLGSVTYRMLCLLHTAVLALPPERVEAECSARCVEGGIVVGSQCCGRCR